MEHGQLVQESAVAGQLFRGVCPVEGRPGVAATVPPSTWAGIPEADTPDTFHDSVRAGRR